MKIYVLNKVKVSIPLIRSNLRCNGNASTHKTMVESFDERTDSENLAKTVIMSSSFTCNQRVFTDFGAIHLSLETESTKYPMVRIQMEGILLKRLQNEYGRRLQLKVGLEIESSVNNVPLTVALAGPGDGEGVNPPYVFTAEVEATWLYNHLQNSNVVLGVFLFVADVAPSYLSPLLDFQASCKHMKSAQDLKIVLENGVEIYCNKERLEAISPVFSNLLNNTFDTSNVFKLETSVANIANISEKAATTFSNILSSNDGHKIDTILKDSKIGFELFEFAHEFMMEPLVGTLKRIFKKKMYQWDVGIAIRLYCSFRLSAEDEVKKTAMNAIKKKWAKLNSSFVFQDLLYRYQDYALQLFALAVEK